MKSFEESLPEASAEWVVAGLISEPQRAAILARHPREEGDGSRFVAILATVGGLLLAVGLSLVVKANWEEIGDWVKIGGLVFLLLAAYGTGWWLKMEGGGYPKTGDAFFMVGALIFMAGIALVSQIYHLNARPATGLLMWWLGIVLVPWLSRSKGAQFVSVVAFLVWAHTEMDTAGSWIEIDTRSEAAFVSIYFFLGLALWLSGLALRGTRRPQFAGLHETLGFLLAGGALYWLGFLRHDRYWHREAGLLELPGSLYFSTALLAAAAVAAWRLRRSEVKSLLPWLALTLVPVAAVVAAFDFGDEGWLWSVVAWMSLFALSVAVIRVGLATGREAWVNLGIAFIALNIVTRYFDLFGTMLEGGLFFMVTGVLLITLGTFLEKKRRALLAEMRTEGRP